MMALRRTLAVAVRPAGVRSFAAAAGDAPPLKLHGIPGRYASATYVAASKAGKLGAVEKDLIAFKAALEKQTGFAAYLGNPTIARGVKIALMEKIFKGSKTTLISQNLLTLLAANARLSDTVRIIEAYAELMKAKRGEVDAVLTTAAPMPKADQDLLAAALAKRAGEGKKVILTTKVDPALIGGMVVQIGDQIIDMSMASKLNEVKRALYSAPPLEATA